MHPRHPIPVVLAVAALAVPAAAQAESIVYIDGGNVWSASPDGKRKAQLTQGGGWHAPAQADDGTLAAVQGAGPIRVMARDGKPLRSLATAGSPLALAFSPDGTKLAYEADGATHYVDAATGAVAGGTQTALGDPEWTDNSRTLLIGGRQALFDDFGPDEDDAVLWWTPGRFIEDGELTRDGERLVLLQDGGADTRVSFWDTRDDLPLFACRLDAADAKYDDPTWSPDGRSVAFATKAGIEVMRLDRVSGDDGCAVDGSRSLTLNPTGTEPDWGPADAPAPTATPTPAATPATTTTPTPTPAMTNTPSPTHPILRVGALGGRTLSVRALRRGASISVKAPLAGPLSATLARGRKTVATGKASARGAGVVKIKLKRVRTAQKLRKRSLTLTVAQYGARSLVRKLVVR